MATNPSRWAQASDVFHRAIALPEADRLRFIAHECGDDTALRAEVESLVDAGRDGTLIGHGPALSAGTRLGAYDIVGFIAAGGMGEIYRARDSRLKREVAIKILPASFASDPGRLARFQREAEILAALDHPNIAGIYGLEETNGTRALVMELVEGETLADRIARGPIALDDALPIVKQIADALEAAHEHGIIHRDLKPANIKITPNHDVKVLDFGLAKLTQPATTLQTPDVTASPTITSPAMMTGVGVLLGTAAYMAPEQAKGHEADKRSDIWAFGCVLYEMLAGTRPFDGEDVTETLAAVLRAQPNWDLLPVGTPSAVRRLLRRCFEKDRKKRLADIADARFEIDEAVNLSSSVEGGAQQISVPRGRVAITATAALVAGAVVAAFATWALTRPAPSPQPQPMRFAIVPPAAQPLVVSGIQRDLDISPDGTHVVYTAGGQLIVRAIDRLDTIALNGTAGGQNPFFSPDGRWVGFFAGGELRKVSIAGGAPITICRVTGNLRGADWGSDDSIVFGTSDPTTGLLSVPAGGGEPRVLTRPERARELDHRSASVLPGGRSVLFTILPNGSIDNVQVAVLDLRTGRQKILIRGGVDAQYVETGHLVYATAGSLRAVRFDLDRLEVLGEPVAVVDDVANVGSVSEFGISQHGTLVYVPGGVTMGGQFGTPRSLSWVDRHGREELIKVPSRTYTYPRLSPDGRRVALDIREQDNDIWIGDLARQTLSRLTFDQGSDYYPVWTPDGRRIVFYSSSGGGNIFWQPADGTGGPERLTAGTTVPHYPYSMSPDGKNLVFQEMQRTTGVDLSLLVMQPKPRTEPLIHSTFIETNAEISPDGHWLAYQSNESGQEEIYVRPFPSVDNGRWQISTAGGTRPAWARSGRELFYLDASGFLTTVPVQTTPAFSAANPTRILNTKYFSGFGGGVVAGRTYDVSPDGQRFLMIKDVGDRNAPPASIIVVVNWTEELKRRVPIK